MCHQSSSNEKKEYISPTTGQTITEPNYITELICGRKAELDNNGILPKKYWNIPKYQKYYKSQVTKASQLLHKYSGIAIINAIKNNRKVYSLRPKWFETVIAKEQDKHNEELKQRKTVIVTKMATRKTSGTKKNLFGEL